MIQSLSQVAETPKTRKPRKRKELDTMTDAARDYAAERKALEAIVSDATKNQKEKDAASQSILILNAEEKADAANKERSGKGTRVRVGQTRGKNPQVISWEAFDDSQPDTLPATLSEFMEITKTQDEKAIVGYLVDGYNDAQYTAASDPIAEFVNYAWPEDVQKQFRLVVRNYSNATGVSLEDAVALIKPGIEASQKKG